MRQLMLGLQLFSMPTLPLPFTLRNGPRRLITTSPSITLTLAKIEQYQATPIH